MPTRSFAQAEVEIGKLHAHGVPGSVHALRLALERLLGSADLRPPAMPPSAVLVVRRMRDPKPGQIANGLTAIRVQSEWERLARQHLAEQYRSAARPALGPVSDGEEAVRFADESELLACLARDTCHGTALQRWWWRSIYRSSWGNRSTTSQTDLLDVLVQQMAGRARYVPGALAQLEQWGEAAHFVHRLTAHQAGRILQALCLVYALPPLPKRVEMPTVAQRPPWRPAVTTPFLGSEQALLLGLSLDLHVRPHEVQTQRYWARLEAWWQSTGSGNGVYREPPPPSRASNRLENTPHADSAPPASIEPTAQIAPIVTPDQRGGAGHEVAAPPQSAHLHNESGPSLQPQSSVQPTQHPAEQRAPRPLQLPAPTDAQDAAQSDPPIAHMPRPEDAAPQQIGPSVQPSAQATQPDLGQMDATHTVQGDAQDGAEIDLPAAHEGDAELILESSRWPDVGVATQLGGVLYLINLMIALDLPECFEDGWRLASRVGPWGLLEAIGREVLGEALAGLEDDLLWAALAHLDGRTPGQPPGWRLPRSRPRRWPSFLLPPAWQSGAREGDAPRGVPPTDRHGGLSLQYHHRVYAPLLARWLALAMPFIVYRLRQALGVTDETNLADCLLRLPGTIYITSTHLDLVTSIENISFAVRLAGLDRNPGWLPEFGRVVYFHFE